MDDETFQDRASRLKAVGEVLEKLPEKVHERAFALLEPYVTGAAPPQAADPAGTGHGASSDHLTDTKEQFFNSFDWSKPADNLKMIAAWLFNEYGDDPFSLEDVRRVAKEVGLTIPDRPNDTLRVAKYEGKKTFDQPNRGKFKPTIAGQTYLKQTFGVKKGTKSRAQE